jgi:pimeloyl-ACP methyl ester carboxylesterase
LLHCAILEDPPWNDTIFQTDELRQARREEWRKTILERKALTREQVVEAGRKVNPKWAELEFGPWSQAKHLVSPQVVEAVGAPRQHWRDLVPQISSPTLLVVGDPELGGLVTPQVAEEISRSRPNIKVVHIAQAGHNIRREQFEKFLEVITAFLKETYH